MGLQPTIDLLNMSRLMTDTTNSLESLRSLEKTYEWLRILQAESAKVAVLVRMDKKGLNEILNKERATQGAAKANAEKLTSSRPSSKSPTEPDEQTIGLWMQTYSVTRKQAIMDIHQRDKAINQFHHKLKMDYETAVSLVRDEFDKKYLAQPLKQ